MDDVLGGMKWHGALVYIDDILIYSQSAEEHFQLLSEVLRRLSTARLKGNIEKSRLWLKKVEYLGHIISSEGIEANPKVDRIKNYPVPRKLKELQSFLSLASYYRRFIPQFAARSAPMRILLKKDTPYVWNDKCQLAFEDIIKALLSPPILRHPDWERPFIIQTDASDEGIAGVLSQVDDNNHEYAVAHTSRALTPAELKWSTMEKEALAVVDATTKFHTYLGDRHFTVITDNGSLSWLLKNHQTGKLARWATRLQHLNFTIQHRSGAKNANADALSRVPREYQPPGEEDDDSSMPMSSLCLVTGLELPTNPTSTLPVLKDVKNDEDQTVISEVQAEAKFTSIDKDQMKAAQHSDQFISQILAYLEEKKEPKGIEASWLEKCNLQDGLVVFSDEGRNKVLVPKTLQRKLIVAYHDVLLCHAGGEKTVKTMKRLFHWIGMWSDVAAFVRSCDPCQRAKNTLPARAGLLQSRNILLPFDVIHIDLFGPIRKSRAGNRFVLTIVDAYTRWPILVPLPVSTSDVVAETIWTNVITVHGCPNQIVTDQGPQFTSKLFKDLNQALGVKLIHSSPYHPQGNAPAERIHRFLKSSLRTMIARTQEDWDEQVPAIEFAYRVSPLSGYPYSPFQLVYGREPRLPADLLFKPSGMFQLDVDEYVAQLCRTTAMASQEMKRIQSEQRRKQKDYHDISHYPVEYVEGDQVLVFLQEQKQGLSTKLISPWRGPYVVLKQTSPVNYLLEKTDGTKKVYHIQRMCLFRPRDPKGRVQTPNTEKPPLLVPASRYHENDLVVFLEGDTWKIGQVLEKREDSLFVWCFGSTASPTHNILSRKFYPSYQNPIGEERHTISSMPEPWEPIKVVINYESVILEHPQMNRSALTAKTANLIQERWLKATTTPTTAVAEGRRA